MDGIMSRHTETLREQEIISIYRLFQFTYGSRRALHHCKSRFSTQTTIIEQNHLELPTFQQDCFLTIVAI